MKLGLIYYLFIATCLLLLSSCESEASKERKRRLRLLVENPISWDTLQISKTIPYEMDSLNFEYTINATYIFPKIYKSEVYKNLLNNELAMSVWGYSDDSLMNSDSIDEKSLLSFIQRKSNGYKYVMDEKMESWNKLNGDSIFNIKEVVDTKVLFNQANFISYQIKTSTYRGENDTLPEINYMNLTFDLANGSLVSEEDMFVDNFSPILNSLLAEKYQEAINKYPSENTNEKFILSPNDISSNGNFYITPDGLNYTYIAGEYGNKLHPSLDLLLTFEELQPIIQEDGLLDIFVKKDADKKIK